MATVRSRRVSLARHTLSHASSTDWREDLGRTESRSFRQSHRGSLDLVGPKLTVG